MTCLIRAARTFSRDHEGASLVEYALMLALITLVCLGAMTILGTKINSFFNSFSSTL